MNTERGEIMVWTRIPTRVGNDVLFDIGATASAVDLMQVRITSVSNVQFVYYSNNALVGTVNLTAADGVPAIGEECLLRFKWDGPYIYGQVDGYPEVYSTRTARLTTFGTANYIQIGTNRSLVQPWGEAIGDFIIFPRPLSALHFQHYRKNFGQQ